MLHKLTDMRVSISLADVIVMLAIVLFVLTLITGFTREQLSCDNIGVEFSLIQDNVRDGYAVILSPTGTSQTSVIVFDPQTGDMIASGILGQ